MLAFDGSAVGSWFTLTSVVLSLGAIVPARQRARRQRARWYYVCLSAAVFAAIGATWFADLIRSDLQFEPPESNHYQDYKGVYDAAPWFGGGVGALVGVALALTALRGRARPT